MLILTVSQLNRYISFKIKDDKKLNGILLKGEISNFKAHRSGHFYFTLRRRKLFEGGNVSKLFREAEIYASGRHERNSYGKRISF